MSSKMMNYKINAYQMLIQIKKHIEASDLLAANNELEIKICDKDGIEESASLILYGKSKIIKLKEVRMDDRLSLAYAADIARDIRKQIKRITALECEEQNAVYALDDILESIFDSNIK